MLGLARRYAHAGPALWVLAATTIANVFAYGYQVIMARLLRPDDYAILTALFGILLLESLSAQVIQSATARIAAQYRARSDEAALHVFVRRWSRRILIGAGAPSLAIVVVSGPVAQALSLPAPSVALLGLALFLSAPLTFTGGLLLGLAHFRQQDLKGGSGQECAANVDVSVILLHNTVHQREAEARGAGEDLVAEAA